MKGNYIKNIRCKHCEVIFDKDSTVSARHYSNYSSFTCSNCGMGDFFEVEERWNRTSVWYNPLTWGSGMWTVKRK